MDTCVPSPHLMNNPFAPSPTSYSIYEQDRPNVHCADSKFNYSLDFYGGVPEESGLLDDNFEDSNLKSFLTPEFLNSMSSSPSTAAFMSNSMNTKMPTEDTSSSYDHGLESQYNPLEIDPDVFLSNFINIDSNDSKLSLTAFDYLASNPPSSCHTPVPRSEARTDFVETADRIGFVSRNSNSEIMSSSSTNGDIVGQDYVKKFVTKKENFPPRKTEPPVVVVAPVKKEDNKRIFDHYPVKMEMKDKALFSLDKAEASPQTVPSFIVSNQSTGCSPVKLEPASPEFTANRDCLKRSSTEDKWDTQHMFGDSLAPSKSKRRRCDSGSSGITSEDGDCDDNDNDYAYNDYDSDDDNSDLDADLAHMKPGGCESLIGVGKKQKQYFWQYNVQAKGPKGTRLKLAVDTPADPHVLNGFEDPVFDEGNTTVAGIRHGGKARKGDGNEVTPNPHKLFKIGHQLLRLNKKINGCQLGSDVPLAQRNEARKEKNKLASRACRLKKKAQHEANKIKLHGLESEHGQINNVLRLLWPELRERAKYLQNEHRVDDKLPRQNLFDKLNGYITSNLKSMVAGHTTDFVNDVIMTVEKGDLSGGLKLKARKS